MCPSYTKKSMDQLIIDYGTRLVTQSRSIHDFVILLGQIRVLESIFRPKKKYWLQVRILDFYHKLFLEHEWYLCPLTAVAYMCCIHVYCDIHLWWLYNMLENYKLHHPSNDNTRTMQKQLNNKFQAGTAKSAFSCAHTKCKL